MKLQQIWAQALILLLACCLFALSGCDDQSSKKTSKSNTTVTPMSEDEEQFWHPYPLHAAANQNDLSKAIVALDNGALINAFNEQNQTALHCAIEHGYKDFVSFLLENGGDPNIQYKKQIRAGRLTLIGKAPLHSAIAENQSDIAVLLLKAGANPNCIYTYETDYGSLRKVYPITIAVKIRSINAIDILMEYGAELEPKSQSDLQMLKLMQHLHQPPTLQNQQSQYKDIFKKWKEEQPNEDSDIRLFYPFPLAIKLGYIDIVEHLHEKGARIIPPYIFLAAAYDQNELVVWLINNGVDVDYYSTPNKLAQYEHPTYNTSAAIAGEIFCISEQHHTALEIAVSRRNYPLISILLERGAKPNNLLLDAAKNGDADTMRILLKHGADPSLRNDDGFTALQVAASKGHRECMEILKSHK